MADLGHYWSGDVGFSASGDLLLASGSEAGKQRVLRRLLTNAGDYLWALDYGAGLPARIGELRDTAAIEAVVRRQMLLEPAVAADPPPEVTVTEITNGVSVSIRYRDAVTGEPVLLGFNTTR
jgi:hypothetical protein